MKIYHQIILIIIIDATLKQLVISLPPKRFSLWTMLYKLVVYLMGLITFTTSMKIYIEFIMFIFIFKL